MSQKVEQAKKEATRNLDKECKKGAKGDRHVKAIFAKQITQCDKQKGRYLGQKAQIQSMSFNLDAQLSMMSMASTMGQAGQVMKQMNQLMNIKEIQKDMA